MARPTVASVARAQRFDTPRIAVFARVMHFESSPFGVFHYGGVVLRLTCEARRHSR
jgi:hypothetical protein